ncbi:hypothetical protein [Desulfosediminicola sp.]|uniref:hypothetical protein n=1 Tax=Desulfosediminicola sp. TaxID=2886825 RepID=UPI003AF2A7DA
MLKSIKVVVAALFIAFILVPLGKSSNDTDSATTIPLLFFAIPFILVYAKEQSVSTPSGYYFFTLIELAGLTIFISYLCQLLFEPHLHPIIFGLLVLVLSALYIIILLLEIYQMFTASQPPSTYRKDERIS